MMILYTDLEPFCCEVLKARVADGGLLPGDVWQRDIRTLTAEELKPYTQIHLFAGIGASPLGLRWAGWPDDLSIVTGGFPCQDISVAGNGAGIDGAHSGLWKEMHRVIDAVRPAWIIAENVPALRTRGIDRVLGDLERIGYECWPLVVGADDVGAPHRRKRVWIVSRLANADDSARAAELVSICAGSEAAEFGGSSEVGNTEGERGRSRAHIQASRQRQHELGGHGSIMADATLGGFGTDGRTRDGEGHADKCGTLADTDERRRRIDEPGRGSEGGTAVGGAGPAMAHANGSGSGQDFMPTESRADWTEQSPRRTRAFGGPTSAKQVTRWPAGPGEAQYEWEAPRLIERGVGVATDGIPGRLARYWNRCALKALGNAQVPQCVELIARSILRMERPA